MGASALTDFGDGLKVAADKMVDLSMFGNKLWDSIKDKAGEPTNIKQEGDAFYYYRNAKVSNGDNAGALAEGGTFGAYDPTLGITLKWPMVTVASVLQMTHTAVKAGGLLGPNGETMKFLQDQGILADWGLKMARQLVGQAKGWLTTVKTGGSSTTITVRDTDLIRAGHRLNVYAVSSDTWTKNTSVGVSGVLTVKSVNHQTGVVTFAANSSAITAGEYIVPNGQYGICLNGIGDIVNDGTTLAVGDYVVNRLLDSFGGKSRADYSGLKTTVSWVGAAGTPTDFTANSLFEWIADMASNTDGQMCGATDVFGHPHTLISVWNAIAQLRTMGIKDNRVEYGSKGECTFSHPTLRDGTVTLKGMGGWKKYILTAFDFSKKENTKLRWAGPPAWVETDETGGIFRYDGKAGSTHTWSAVFDVLVGMPWNPQVTGILAGIQLPLNKQVA